jgi:hypothetical protein
MILFNSRNKFYAVIDKWDKYQPAFSYFELASYEDHVTEIVKVEELEVPLIGFHVNNDVIFSKII